ncbi:MAG: hypothetical protein C4539_11210 [Ignavibacteriales bacterium]|nr:MAG: hypothetical protein C4539_11210 [Ignavibacteriales bacterium]
MNRFSSIKNIFLLIYISLTVQVLCNNTDSLSVLFKRNIEVDSIIITGNERTEPDIITRELTFKTGDLISKQDINFNRERVYSLGLFNFVKMFSVSDSGKSNIVIQVDESWYLWPLPVWDIEDSSIKKLTYGMVLLYKNFRGRNETLSAEVGFGYDPFYSFSYYNPWLIQEYNISLKAAISYSTITTNSISARIKAGKNFEFKNINFLFQVGKRINLYSEIFITSGFNYIEMPDDLKKLSTASGKRIDNVVNLGIDYLYDTRNLKQFPDSGLVALASFNNSGFGINNINFSTLFLDFRNYMSIIGNLTGKWRLASRMTFGNNVPFYSYSYLGSGEKVRGHYNQLREGNHFYLASAEIKYPIIKEWNFSIKLPLIPVSLTSYRIALFTNMFFDTGATQFKNETISTRSFYSGYGCGLSVLFLPYNILRIELALDEHKNVEYIFDLGFSF